MAAGDVRAMSLRPWRFPSTPRQRTSVSFCPVRQGTRKEWWKLLVDQTLFTYRGRNDDMECGRVGHVRCLRITEAFVFHR